MWCSVAETLQQRKERVLGHLNLLTDIQKANIQFSFIFPQVLLWKTVVKGFRIKLSTRWKYFICLSNRDSSCVRFLPSSTPCPQPLIAVGPVWHWLSLKSQSVAARSPPSAGPAWWCKSLFEIRWRPPVTSHIRHLEVIISVWKDGCSGILCIWKSLHKQAFWRSTKNSKTWK